MKGHRGRAAHVRPAHPCWLRADMAQKSKENSRQHIFQEISASNNLFFWTNFCQCPSAKGLPASLSAALSAILNSRDWQRRSPARLPVPSGSRSRQTPRRGRRWCVRLILSARASIGLALAPPSDHSDEYRTALHEAVPQPKTLSAKPITTRSHIPCARSRPMKREGSPKSDL